MGNILDIDATVQQQLVACATFADLGAVWTTCLSASKVLEPCRLVFLFARTRRVTRADVPFHTWKRICVDCSLAMENSGLPVSELIDQLQSKCGIDLDFNFHATPPGERLGQRPPSIHPRHSIEFFAYMWEWACNLQQRLPGRRFKEFVKVVGSPPRPRFNSFSITSKRSWWHESEDSAHLPILPDEDIAVVLFTDALMLSDVEGATLFHGKGLFRLQDRGYAVVCTSGFYKGFKDEDGGPRLLGRFKFTIQFDDVLERVLPVYIAIVVDESPAESIRAAKCLSFAGTPHGPSEWSELFFGSFPDFSEAEEAAAGAEDPELLHRAEKCFMNLIALQWASGGSGTAVARRNLTTQEAFSRARVDDDAEDITIVNIKHSEPAAFISPVEASAVETAQEAGRVERMLNTLVPDVEHLQHKQDGELWDEEVILCTLNRRPRELMAALAAPSGPLKQCTQALESEGHSWKLLEGALVFVHPHQYRATMRALCGKELHPSNLVFARSLEHLVEQVLAMVGKGAWPKKREELDIDSGSVSAERDTSANVSTTEPVAQRGGDDDGDADIVLVEQRTFLAFVQAPRDAATVVQSTTEATGRNGLNPRRQLPGGVAEI